MKIKSVALMLVTLTCTISFLAGCHYKLHDNVLGSGVRQTQKRDVSPFTSIAIEGAYDVEVVCQKDQSVEITGDDNILPLITTEVSNNVLHIRSRRGYSTEDGIKVKITVPNLEGISGSGAGQIKILGINNDKFEVDVNGAPSISAAGDTKLLKVQANGAAKIDTHKLRADQVEINSNGVSRVEVNAVDKLNVTIAGPSHVIYEGEPEVTQTIHGPGKLEKRESRGE